MRQKPRHVLSFIKAPMRPHGIQWLIREATAARAIVDRADTREEAQAIIDRLAAEGPHGRDKYRPGNEVKT